MMRNYGKPPKNLGLVDLQDDGEMMCYVYLPIKFPRTQVKLPDRLQFIQPLLIDIYLDMADGDEREDTDFSASYIYATVKRLFVEKGAPGNRPGWHADGYGSGGDLNYIWYDMNPTWFAEQEFVDIPDDDFKSMAELTRQIRGDSINVYPDRHLLRLDEDVVHQVNPDPRTGVRTFIKVSVSKHIYNLRGNSHNYLFDYNWEMYDREILRRNCDNKDFV